ncbi:penicillin-binding protein 1A [uncultured Alsobacter sp.]|uniref:penicillin-binding protein 1A n=1 Tax=uncultured Alsobacter sp. TaxID=1748258 RepID=UPI0025DB6E8D|nr:penicillin-binding protein 1A [uncultured Alsobacter sp.]
MRYIMRFFGWLFAAGAIAFVIGSSALGVLVWHFSRDLPDTAQLRDYEPPVMTRVHAGDGRVIAEFARERRLYLPIQAVPKLMIKAFISAEDKNFYTHIGVDPEGLARAAIANFRNRGGNRRPQGASTITQQVAKIFLVGSEQSLDRKIREALVALKLEKIYSKDKILELYLNEIYLGAPLPGQGSYGVAAAALAYFDKSVDELTLHEVAYLAALPKAPSDLHPFRNRDRALERRNYVLDRMVENGYVDRVTADVAKKQPLDVHSRTVSATNIGASYFVEEIRRELQDRYGEKKLLEGGLSVRSTIDPQMQLQARKALVDGLVRYDETRGWRGPIDHIALTGTDWGLAIGAQRVLSDIAPWRLAVVLDVSASSAKLGLHPLRDGSGQLSAAREVVTLSGEGFSWTGRKQASQAVSVGDVVYVEPMAGHAGQVRLRQLPLVNGAIVAMEPFSGRVLAMIGGFSSNESVFNRATQAFRQPGSSFKPFVYAAALDNGYTPSTIVMDTPIEIDQGPGVGIWRPENSNGKSTGPHTLRYGIQFSKNQMTVRLANDIGMPLIAEYARRFGIYDDMQPLLSMSLGAGETTVMRMTAAYSMLVNGGRRIRPTLVDRIQDRHGRTIFRYDQRVCEACSADAWTGQAEPKITDNSAQVLDPLTAYQMVSILEGVVQSGTGRVVSSVGKPLAGKTGTTNDAKDLWFVGFSPDLAVGVFMGYDTPKSLGTSAGAAQYAAPIFRDFMTAALKDKPATPFRVPPGIKLIHVDPQTGMRANGNTAILEAFKPGTAPPDTYSVPSIAPPWQASGTLTSGSGGLY